VIFDRVDFTMAFHPGAIDVSLEANVFVEEFPSVSTTWGYDILEPTGDTSISIQHDFSGAFGKNGVTSFNKSSIGVNYE